MIRHPSGKGRLFSQAARHGFAACACALLAATPLSGQAGRAPVQEGNRLYEEGRFQEAYQKYLEALQEAPGSPLIRFNEGNALYRNDDYARALEAYQAALEGDDPALASAAWYNLGNALYREQKLRESLEAYKQALRADPGDVDAKHNFERALQQLQEQEENQNQDQDQQQGEGQDQQDQQDQGGQQGEDENDSEDQGGQDPESPPQDPEQGQGQPDEQEPQGEQEQEPQPQPGEMSREEAEHLLQAVQEDPDEVNRKPAQEARGRKPRKKW